MTSDVENRYAVNKTFMRGESHWQKSIGIITCKMLRERHKRPEFHRIQQLLSSEEFRDLVEERNWQMAFTGGTFKDLGPPLSQFPAFEGRLHGYAPSALGVIQLANLVVHGYLIAVLFFNDMEDLYADSPQNLCLRRICNHYNVPLLEDFSSIEFILRRWKHHQIQSSYVHGKSFPKEEIQKYFGKAVDGDTVLSQSDFPSNEREENRPRETLAVISHNKMKMEMLNFCLKHMSKILSYRRVLTTGTTGEKLTSQYISALTVLRDNVGAETLRSWPWAENCKDPEEFVKSKIHPFKSGPDGGDIQISSKVIDGTCHRVLFFQDPQTAHPHQFDIRMMEKVTQDEATAALFATSAEMAELIV